MEFTTALVALKLGARVAREGWDRGQFVAMQEGYPDGIAINANTARATGIPEGTTVVFPAYFIVRGPDGSITPWVPNVIELLADDWALVPVAQ